jgi:acetyl esterase/lipase
VNRIGAAGFLLDCFTGRGITQTITDQSQLDGLTMIVDIYRALALLAKHTRIDASRIEVMGFSKGGFAALYSSLKRFQRMHGTGVMCVAISPSIPLAIPSISTTKKSVIARFACFTAQEMIMSLSSLVESM